MGHSSPFAYAETSRRNDRNLLAVVIGLNGGQVVAFLTFVAGPEPVAPLSLSISYLASHTVYADTSGIIPLLHTADKTQTTASGLIVSLINTSRPISLLLILLLYIWMRARTRERLSVCASECAADDAFVMIPDTGCDQRQRVRSV